MLTVFRGFHTQCESNMFDLAIPSENCQRVEGNTLKARYAIYMKL